MIGRNCGWRGWIVALMWTVVYTNAGPSALAQISSGYSDRFPDFNLEHVPPREQYDGALFQLSQDYPSKRPEMDRPLIDILSIPYDQNEMEENWRKYLLAVRDYCFDGNTSRDWRGQDNPVRTWYHVPWQHLGKKGREGIHGLTREAAAEPGQLAVTQTELRDSHAVAMYNPLGGYAIGKVWCNQFEPDPSAAKFPVGTVVVKVLFTQATPAEVPYLNNPIVWKAFVRESPKVETRKVQDLRLIQMDIMVRDDRANNTGGWVFGTYCYNGMLGNRDPWQNLVPVGIQWGNDPDIVDPADNQENAKPVTTKINAKLKQTIINDKKDELPPQHLGWGGRLNGPADYYRSSCMSCHSTAQYPQIVDQHPDFKVKNSKVPAGTAHWNTWFRNLDCGEPFSPSSPQDQNRAISTDYSLQLSIGIEHFYKWKSEVMRGYFTPVLPTAPRPDRREERVVPTSEFRETIEP